MVVVACRASQPVRGDAMAVTVSRTSTLVVVMMERCAMAIWHKATPVLVASVLVVLVVLVALLVLLVLLVLLLVVLVRLVVLFVNTKKLKLGAHTLATT